MAIYLEPGLNITESVLFNNFSQCELCRRNKMSF